MSTQLDMSVKDFSTIIIDKAYMLENNQVLQLRLAQSTAWGNVNSVQFDKTGISISAEPFGAVTLSTANKYVFSVTDEHEVAVRSADNNELLCVLRLQAMQNIPILSRGDKQKFKAE